MFGFQKKKNNTDETTNLLVGYLRTESCRLMGHEFTPQNYTELAESASASIQKTLVQALNPEKQQEVVDVLSEFAGDKLQEVYGDYLVQLWVRWSMIVNAHSNGKVSGEEYSFELISDVLLRDIRNIIKQSK